MIMDNIHLNGINGVSQSDVKNSKLLNESAMEIDIHAL